MKVTILPLPKRLSRAKAFGFCGGNAVGEGESRGPGVPHWWPGGKAEALTHPTQKRLSARMATGDVIPGFWTRSSGGFGGAVGWRLVNGALEAVELEQGKGWESTIAMGAGGGAFAGSGERKTKKGERSVDVALFWRPDGSLVELPPAEPGSEAAATATDGEWVVGHAGRTGGQRAALWPADGSRLVLLGDDRSLSEASAVGDGEQVGLRWTRQGSVAALWRGSAASFVDLHAFVPAPWNASSAAAVEVRDGVLRIVGTVTQFAATDELTPRESQYLVATQPALWETPLD